MAWDIQAEGSLIGTRLPHSWLRQQFSVQWKGPGDAIISTLTYSASVPDIQGCSWPTATAALVPGMLMAGGRYSSEFVLPLQRGFIQAVEDWRKGQPNVPRIDVRATVGWLGLQESGARPQREELFCSIRISRDEWLSLLALLGWDEFETFEVPVRALKEHGALSQGLTHLRNAQLAFRLGQWPTVVTDARKAIEAAASATGEEDERKGYEALVAKVLPVPADNAKRGTLSNLMLALKPLRNEAAHGGNLECQLQREDAELALMVAVSIFRYMGESLARLDGRRT